MDMLVQTDIAEAPEWRQFRAKVAAEGPEQKSALLADRARGTRRSIVATIARAGQGHIGGDLSVTDLLTTPFNAILQVTPEDPQDPDRDRFVLSKGRCAVALYTTLASCGFFPEAELETFGLREFAPTGSTGFLLDHFGLNSAGLVAAVREV